MGRCNDVTMKRWNDIMIYRCNDEGMEGYKRENINSNQG